MTNNVYKFLIFELGIAIVDEKNQIQSFKKFPDPIKSRLRIKNRDYEEISESLEFFKGGTRIFLFHIDYKINNHEIFVGSSQ